jgi:hypothetical protein
VETSGAVTAWGRFSAGLSPVIFHKKTSAATPVTITTATTMSPCFFGFGGLTALSSLKPGKGGGRLWMFFEISLNGVSNEFAPSEPALRVAASGVASGSEGSGVAPGFAGRGVASGSAGGRIASGVGVASGSAGSDEAAGKAGVAGFSPRASCSRTPESRNGLRILRVIASCAEDCSPVPSTLGGMTTSSGDALCATSDFDPLSSFISPEVGRAWDSESLKARTLRIRSLLLQAVRCLEGARSDNISAYSSDGRG